MNNPSMNQNLVQRSLAHVWHPCTQMKHHESFPLVAITHGKGPWLFTEKNEPLLDCISSWWTNLFGHTNPRINAAIKNQLEQIEHVMLAGFTHPPVVELSEKLFELAAGNLGHAFYASDGASAVEIALKMSHHFWRLSGKTDKKKFVCLANGYHGETLGALTVTDVPLFRESYGGLLKEVFTVMSPDARQANDGENAQDVSRRAIADLTQLFENKHAEIAAFIVEPLVQCAGQMGMYCAEYLKNVRELCNRYEIHLIADEIAVGCGRSGKFFACEHANIWPDFLTLSKGISGGYLPLSLCLTTSNIYQAFYKDEMSQGFLHSHSYTGNPLACAAAVATLDIFKTDNIIEGNINQSALLKKAFEWVNEEPSAQHLRQQGMILAFDINPKAFQHQKGFAKEIFKYGLENQVLVRPIGNTIYVMPPYILNSDEISMMGQNIQKTLHQTLSYLNH